MSGSVTIWYENLSDQRQRAVLELWNHFFTRLVGIARRKLGQHRRVEDEEDVALNAFHSFIRSAEGGKFEDVRRREDLWQLLVVITVRKAIGKFQHETRLKRGGGNVKNLSAMTPDEEGTLFEAELRGAGDPALEAEMLETYDRLLRALGDDNLKAVALAKLDGYTNPEIALKLGVSVSGVERRLRSIRGIWANQDADLGG